MKFLIRYIFPHISLLMSIVKLSGFKYSPLKNHKYEWIEFRITTFLLTLKNILRKVYSFSDAA